MVEGGPTRSLLRARDYILASGSIPTSIKAARLDGNRVGTSTEAIAWKEVPKTLVVIGAGYIGLELGSVWRRLGSKVIVVEELNRILPGTDADLANQARRIFMKQGLEFAERERTTRFRPGRAPHCAVRRDGDDRMRTGAGSRRPYAEYDQPRPGDARYPTRRTAADSRQWPLPDGLRRSSTQSAIASAARCWPTRRRTKHWPALK